MPLAPQYDAFEFELRSPYSSPTSLQAREPGRRIQLVRTRAWGLLLRLQGLEEQPPQQRLLAVQKEKEAVVFEKHKSLVLVPRRLVVLERQVSVRQKLCNLLRAEQVSTGQVRETSGALPEHRDVGTAKED